MVRPRHEDGHRGIGYVVVMTATGRAREVHPLMWAIAPFFVAFRRGLARRQRVLGLETAH
jgi:hypothetical protein